MYMRSTAPKYVGTLWVPNRPYSKLNPSSKACTTLRSTASGEPARRAAESNALSVPLHTTPATTSGIARFPDSIALSTMATIPSLPRLCTLTGGPPPFGTTESPYGMRARRSCP